MPCSGSGDSAAAMVTISVPMKVNIVVSIAAITAPKPLGMKPPLLVRWVSPEVFAPGSTPKMASRPTAMKATIATTLTRANQNSNSP